jgi:hypothetical protein
MSDDVIKRLRDRLDSWRESGATGLWVNFLDLAALLDRIDKVERENERLRKFAGNVLEKSREEFLDLSCGDIEDWAKQCGLLEQVEMTAACGDDCQCAEWADFPLECLRPTALGSAAIDAAREKENQS